MTNSSGMIAAKAGSHGEATEKSERVRGECMYLFSALQFTFCSGTTFVRQRKVFKLQ